MSSRYTDWSECSRPPGRDGWYQLAKQPIFHSTKPDSYPRSFYDVARLSWLVSNGCGGTWEVKVGPEYLWRGLNDPTLDYIYLEKDAAIAERVERSNAKGASSACTTPATAMLVVDFANALDQQLALKEKQHGYTDEWTKLDWMHECRSKVREHIKKGNPLDVAAYCAFLWWHGERTNG